MSAKIRSFTPEEWHEQMFTEVKVAYRLIEVYGPPDVDAEPYDADFTARVDAEYDHWLAEVRRQAAEEAYERGRLDERHDCNRYTEYQQGKIAAEQLQRDLRSRNPYRAALGLTAEQEGENDA